MPVIETKGAASSQGFGEFAKVGGPPVYIEDVMSVFLYTGTGSDQTLTTGVDLSTYGGMIWSKRRSAVENHFLQDTNRGLASRISSNTTGAAATTGAWPMNAISTTGMTVSGVNYAAGGETYVSWTFRKAPKFFDVVTWTGDGTTGRVINHSLGSTPGCIIIKRYDSGSFVWTIFHRSLQDGLTGSRLLFDTSAATNGLSGANIQAADATTVTLGSIGTNTNGGSFVCYLFAHNAGGFGLTGTDNVISCGFLSGAGTTVNLGWEPQWILAKRTDTTGNWYIDDNMRGWPAAPGNDNPLLANTSGAEPTGYAGFANITSTGFTNNFNGDYIYIAIRRGPMKTPTSGTSVFAPVATTGDNSGFTGQPIVTNFPVDLTILGYRNYATNKYVADRLRGITSSIASGTTPELYTNSTNAEAAAGDIGGGDSNTQIKIYGAPSSYTEVNWNFRRAPGFFDVVCYTGNSAAGRTVNHNLGVSPEMMILKSRSVGGSNYQWWVYQKDIPPTPYATNLALNSTDAAYVWSDIIKTPTTTTFGINDTFGNAGGTTYVAYLFASCPGVSKVGSYTGNGTTQTINCGFTGGARFVLIKRTDSTGDWYVYDTARGMTTLTDPYLLLNSTAAESATLGSVTTVSTGFALNASILAAINTNGASYIFLAIS